MLPNFMNDKLIKMSYAEKRDLVICPQRYKLINIDKVKQRFAYSRFSRADAIDEGFTEWVRKGCPENKLASICEETFNRLVAGKQNAEQPGFREYVVNGANLLEDQMRKHDLIRPKYMLVQDRLKAEFWGEGIKLTGRSDLFYTDTMDLYDIKFTENKQWLDWKQLTYYAVIYTQMYGRRVRKVGFLVPLINPPVQEETMTNKAFEMVFDEVRECARRIRENDLETMTSEPDKNCYLCLVKHACPKNNRMKSIAEAPNGRVTIQF